MSWIKKVLRSFDGKITEKDFEGAPETEEPDGVYQFFILNDKIYYRNKETGKITSEKFEG